MKSRVVKIPFLKICSVVTAICFLVSTIGNNLYASVITADVSQCNNIFESMSVIKQEYGKVTAIQDSSSDVTVVNIQDLHCHEQTQRNISEIIKTLDKNYSLKSIFIEGGYGQIDVSWVNKVKDEKIKNLITEKMLQDGYLTGAEYYVIQNSKHNLLKGIEERDIHQSNLDRLSKIMRKQPEYNSVMSRVNKEIEVLSNIYLNEKNKRFSRKINEYRNGKTDTLKFYRLLEKYVKKIQSSPDKYNNIVSINLEDYPNISKYLDISGQSRDANPRQVSIEMQTLVNVIKNKIPYVSYRKLLDVTNNFNDTEKLVEFLAKFCDQYNIDLSKDFKELNKFFTANRLNQRLNPIELVNEERKLIEQIRMALSYDNTEYEISYINDFAKYFDDYLTYSLTSSDWKYVKQDFEKFRLFYTKYAVVDRINEISSDIDFINKYYDTNDIRNDIFISNVLNNENPQQNLNPLRTSEEILKQSKEVVVVITGGYHSEDLKSMFADRKVNDIVITPNVVGDIKNANKRYDSIIRKQTSIQSNALAFRIASCLSDENQKNLMVKVAVEILGKDNIVQIQQLLGKDIDISKIEDIEIDEQKKSDVQNLIQTTVNSLVDALPQKAGQNIFNPDIDNILTEMSLKLYDMGFYFENGAVYEIDSSEYKDKDLFGIPVEVYSRMFASLQKAMLKTEQIRDGISSKLPTDKNIKIQWSSFPDKAFVLIQEILFRAFPALIFIFNPVIGIPLFVISQMVSLSLEIFIQWKAYQKLDVKNPDFFKKYVNKLPLITILLTAPYAVALATNILYLPIALVLTIVIHYLFVKKFSVNKTFNNKSVSPFLLAPSMGIFWRATGTIERYRTALKNRNDKKAGSEKYKLKKDVSYETILRDQNNSTALETIIKNEQLDVKYRLFALMYLKTNNLDIYKGITENVIDKEITEKIKKDFKNSLQKNKIKNNFDLQANLTGIFLILDDILHEQLHGNSYRIYEEIQDAVIVRYGMASAVANDDFIFGAVDYETLAHELGHRILKYSSMEGDLTLGELFAETVSNLIAREFNIIPSKNSAQLYGLFDPNVNYIRVFQEEHEAADGFLNLIKQSTEKNPNWLVLIDTIINYGYYREGVKRPSAQGAILKDILVGYEERLKQTDESDIVDFAKKKTAKTGIVMDILKDIKEKNPYQYDNILKKIRSKAKIQKSYQQENIDKTKFWQSKSKVEELFNIIEAIFSSEKLYDFEIIAAIFSSPDNIDSVLNDMFDVIFKDTDYSMYDFENLYKIKSLMAHDRTYTSKEELEQYLKPIIDLITSSRRTEPTKDDFINLKKNKRYTLKKNFRLMIVENFNKLGLPELVDTLFPQKTYDTNKTGSKLSIFDALKSKNSIFAFLAKTAPVWEEIVFRAIPSLITIFNPFVGIPLFAVSQIAFLFSHTIVKWLTYRDSAGNRLNFASILKNDLKNLSLPALTVSIPYIISMIVGSVLPIAVITSIAIHYLHNKINPQNPMELFSSDNMTPDNIEQIMQRYAKMLGSDRYVKEKIKIIDKNLVYRLVQTSSDSHQTLVNIITKMQYVDPMLINHMESYEYVSDIFEASDALLQYIGGMGFDSYNFNLFFKLRKSAGIKNEEFSNIWLANIIRDDIKMQYLDSVTLMGLETILKIFGPERNLDTIQYLFNKLCYADSFDFNKFFKLVKENDLTKNQNKLKLLQTSFDNGFEDNADEILGFSDVETAAVIEVLDDNDNKTALLNFRLFSELKEMLGVQPDDKNNIRFLAKYCFNKGNIVETGKLTNKLDENIFVQNLKIILKNENKEYILTSLLADLTVANIYLSDSQAEQIMRLLEEMTKMDIKNLAVSNENLALKVFLSPAFVTVFNSQVSKENFKNIDNMIQRYRRAIAVGIFMNQLLNGREELLTPENFDKIVKISTDAYFSILEQWFNKKLADKDSVVTAIFHDESADIVFKDIQGDRFNPEILKKFLNKIGIDTDTNENVKILQRSKDPGVKFKILDSIINSPKNGKKSLFWFDGHGSKNGFSITASEHIYFEEIADALRVAYTNGVDLKNLTLVFNSCHSGDFKDKILTMLEERSVKDSPVIITIAGHETELGYTDIVEHDGDKLLVSNLEFSIFNLFESSSNADSENNNLLLGDFILAQSDVNYSNPTISIPLTEDVRKIIEKTLSQIDNVNKQETDKSEESSLLVRTGIGMSIEASESVQATIKMPSASLELSIFGALKNKSKVFSFLAKTAPVWEEILFRTIPSAVTIFNPVVGISLFVVSQIVFLFSHTIVKWLVYKDTAGNRLNFASILKDDFKNLSLPTLAVSIPYVLTMIINPVFWPMAAVSSIIIHSLFNDKLSILGYFKNIKLKDNFDLKLPIQALNIKAGAEIFVTYLANDKLIISRNKAELDKFCEEYTANKPAHITSRIYANTVKIIVKNNGTVNVKQLYKNKLERYPLTQEQKNNITLFYSQVPIKSEEKTETISDKPVKDNSEENIKDALIDKIGPVNVIDFDFSQFITGEKQNADIKEIREYVKSIIIGKDLRNNFISVTFSNLTDNVGLDENKIKIAGTIISVLSDEFNEIFADSPAGAPGVTYFEDMIENAFVHGNNLSLNKKIFIYFGNDRDVLVINSNTPQNKTVEALALASKLYLYGFGSGIKSAEIVNNARYAITDLIMPDKTTKELYIAYISFKKYQKLKATLLDRILKKINLSAIWHTIATRNIERQYSYTVLPVLKEGESVIATNFVKEGAEYSDDWIECKISKKDGKYIISNINKRENKLKWGIPLEWQIHLDDKLEITEENGKFYVCSNYSDIRILEPQNEQGLETDTTDYSTPQQPPESLTPRDISTQQDITRNNREFESLFRLVHRDSIAKPVIGDSENYGYRLRLQKAGFELAEKLDLNEMEELYKDDEDKLSLIGYLKILKLKRTGDNQGLKSIVYNGRLNIKYRLMAYMYLRGNGVNDFNDGILGIMKANFLIELQLNSFKIDNNFDLSMLGAGILLILSQYLRDSKYLDEQQERNLYDNISYSTFVEKNEFENTSANSGMFFTSPDPLTMAHEIGHRVLLFYTDSSKGVSYSTIHEIFANVISAVFAEKAGIGSKYYEDALYELFNEKMQYDYVLQEEHRASRGLLYAITEIAKQMGKTAKFEILADAVINLVKSQKVLPKRQSDTIKDIVYEYMNMLRFKDNYTQDEIAKFEGLLKEESWKSKVLELFMNLRSSSGTRWDYYGKIYKRIMDGMRAFVVQPESYRYGMLQIDYRDDLVVINNIIMSQPDKINIVLQIVKDELSQDDYLLRTQIAKLIFADLIISLPQMKQLTKYQLDRLIQEIIDKFFSDKMDYKASEIDYNKIRIYALGEYSFFKTVLPRNFGERNTTKKDLFGKNFYEQKTSYDESYKYAESLPSFVPSIDTFFMLAGISGLYRKLFDFIVKKIAGLKQRPKFSQSVENYLSIVKNNVENKFLLKIIYNDRASVKYRLFALMNLRNRGYDISDKSVVNDIKREFAKAINANSMPVNNNFDLRSVLAGVYLLLENFSREYVDSKQEIEIYKSISKAVVLRRGKESIGARANMTFVSLNPLTMAHELGHKILAYTSESSLKDITIHELFAEITANLFARITGVKEKEYKDVLYGLFDNSVNYDDVFQDEHKASTGFIELLRMVSSQAGKNLKWDILANAVISYTKNSSDHIAENNQGKNLKNIFIEYLTQLDKNRQYTRSDLNYMFSVAQRATKGETVVMEILEDIKKTNAEQYENILKRLQSKIKLQKSYMKGLIPRLLYSKSKIKEISDIFKEFLGIKSEYKDDADIITKLIFSQPKRIKDILRIIINQILSKREFSKYDFENVIRMEFMLNTDKIYSSKKELDSDIRDILNNIVRNVSNDAFHRNYNVFDLSDYKYAKKYIERNKAGTLQTKKTIEILNRLGSKIYNQRSQAENFKYSIFGIATGVVLETFSFWMPSFIKQHENPTKTMIITTWVIRILSIGVAVAGGFMFVPAVVPIVLIATEWITHFVYNLFEIKKIDKNISVKFESVDTFNSMQNLSTDSAISVLLVKDIKNMDPDKLINTGLKVNGETIWQIDREGVVSFGASNTNIQDLAMVLNGSRILERQLRKVLKLKNMNLNVESSAVIDEKSEEMYFQNTIAVVNNNKYVQSMLKAFKSIAFMYSQKTMISLEGVSNNKLYQSLTNGKVRKIITPEQFEYIKSLIEKDNKNVSEEILNLRQQGIEIYVKENELTDKYKEYGIIGLLLNNEIYDYYTAEKTEIETVDARITLQELERKLINSEKPLLIDIASLQNIFKSTRNIVGAYSGLEALIGNIKIKFGFKNIQAKDMENFAYAIDMNDIPAVSDEDINEMVVADIVGFTGVLQLDDSNIISIILRDTGINENNKKLFLNIIKEKVLLKNAQQNKEREVNLKYLKYGLKDKKLEILLGKALWLRIQLAGNQSIDGQKNIDDNLSNLTPLEIMKKITELSQQAFDSRDSKAIDTIIELIMTCAEEYKNDDMVPVATNDLLREYKSMLAAA
ncbi:MAG: hypothetical protein PHR82_00385 [Endomicrobiaceae bacterium]|nr:hypothetical protein [Endomicrobiaceae bacterium]